MLALRDLQSRFFRSLARQPGAGPMSFDPLLVGCVESRGPLVASERLDIYAQMYFSRLVDVLQSDFPRTTTVLGCERFHAVAADYLAQYPSTDPSLRHLGRNFAAFLQEQADIADLPFLSDLAALEWTRLTVFDAPDSIPLRIEHLQSLTPEQWPTLRFQTIPALQITRHEWPAHAVWEAAEEEARDWQDLQPEPTVLKVWRDGFSVYHASIDTPELMALERFLAGTPFAAVCAALETVLPAEEAASIIGSLLLRWIEDGILAQPAEL